MSDAHRTRRTAGRPAAHKQVQRDQLLDLATQAFAHTGIQASSLRMIAESAGVTPALLNYYFGNKQQLVDAMVEERFLPLVRGNRRTAAISGRRPATPGLHLRP